MSKLIFYSAEVPCPENRPRKS